MQKKWCVVTERCWDCKDRVCLAVCPIDCFFERGEGRRVYIHPDECFECLCCYVDCPREAIFPASALPPGSEAWVERNAQESQAPDARRLSAIPLPATKAGPRKERSAATAYRHRDS